MSWQPWETAPKDGTVIEILSSNFGRLNAGSTVYRARWARIAEKWLNWADLNEELLYGRRWRLPEDFQQPRQWTEEEETNLALLHRPDGSRKIPAALFMR